MENGLSFRNFVKQTRPINLVFIALAQLTLFIALIYPSDIEKEGLNQYFIWAACIFSTLLFTLGGYFINDFYDFENDKAIKKKNKFLNKSQLLLSYSISVILNLVICIFACAYLNEYSLLLFFICITGILYSYSSYFKRHKISGNIIVSFLSSSSLGIVLITSYFIDNPISEDLYQLVQFFMLFIFTLTMAREITKDCEDLEGDQKFNVDSIPIRFGKNKSKILINLFHFLLVFISLTYFYIHRNNFSVLALILGAIIVLKTLFVIHKLSRADDKKSFKFVADIQKGVFGLGIILLALQLYNI